MPVNKKQNTTPQPSEEAAQKTEVAPMMPSPETFHEYLRGEIRLATRQVMEEIMREELTQFIGAEWGESSPERKGHRNGYYTRDLGTTNGSIEDLKVPRDREGDFHTQVFERYSRYEPQIEQGLTEMFVSGTSTEKVGKVAQTLLGVNPSASAVSRLNHSLTEQYEAWRQRPLQAHYRVIYLDGVYYTVRHGDQTDSTVVLTALGVDMEGKREVLTLRACAEESKDGWSCLLQDLLARGVCKVDLFVTDGHIGILSALAADFPATPRQRCVVHKMRNVLNAIPKREQPEVSAELSAIWKQSTREEAQLNLIAFQAKYQKRYPEAVRSLVEDEDHLLTFYAFPPVMHRYVRTTNAIESFFSNVRQRTNSIDTFTTEESCLAIIWAVMQDIRLQRIPVE